MLETGDGRITLAYDGPVAVITLARPDKLNALDYEMVLALERAADSIDARPEIRVAIITGQGDWSFCAGGDIEAWSSHTPGGLSACPGFAMAIVPSTPSPGCASP